MTRLGNQATTKQVDSQARVQNVLSRLPVDRIPIHDAFWEDTLTLWQTQGLGEDVSV